MKSHELAKKLLELPDLEVYSEIQHAGQPNREFKTVKFDGDVVITPTGLFLEPGKFFVKGYSDRSPNDEPVIGSYMIYFSNGEVIKDQFDESRICTPTVKFLSTGESRVHEYGTYNMEIHDNHKLFQRAHDKHIVLITNVKTYEEKPHYKNDENYELRYIEDIDFVNVLVSYDPVTWKPQYQRMTYGAAIQYGKSL